MTAMQKAFENMFENIVEKDVNYGRQHFFLFLFSSLSFNPIT